MSRFSLKQLTVSFLLTLTFILNVALSQSDAALSYDVVVVGSEPEGIAAAVAAAESGARTLLLTEDSVVGGLFVQGGMNSLDLRSTPFSLQQGLFERWWRSVGRGHAFDVVRAEAVFVQMLREAGVVVRTSAPELLPVLDGNSVVGVRVAGASDTAAGVVNAPHIIDATSEMDFAAAAGAAYSFGFSAIGHHERMADTLVFRIDGVDWDALVSGIRQRGKGYASVDDFVAWGHFGGYPAAYDAVEEGVRLRGLNLGRQEDGSVLVNALLIYGVDPFDPESVAEGRARAEREAPRIIDYLSKELPGFEGASYGGAAASLYIRETRHLEALCRLTVDDVLDNKVTPLDVAAGGYPLDVQTLTPSDSGYVYGAPDIYGVQLCVTVPAGLTNLWVVGKAAGYDALAASSARVVPFGMALGEAVGVAAALGVRQGLTPEQIVRRPESVAQVRERLLERGAYLPEVRPRNPAGPYTHPYYRDYRLLLSRGLAVGGYDNDPDLDKEMTALSYIYLLSNVAQRFFYRTDVGTALVERHGERRDPLSAELALALTAEAACLLGDCVAETWDSLVQAGIVSSTLDPSGTLTRGEMYALAAGIARLSFEP